MSETALKPSQMTAQERREKLIDDLYVKLEDPTLPGHAYAKIAGTIGVLEKVNAREEVDDEPVAVSLAAAFEAMPVEHAQELLVSEIARLREAIDSYRERLVELVGEEAAEAALA